MQSKFTQYILKILFALTLITVLSCEKKVEYDLLKGDLYGNVTFASIDNDSIIDYSKIRIVAEGSDPLRKEYSDKDGNFIFKDLQTGTYNFVFYKEGYSQNKIIGFEYIGGENPMKLYNTMLVEYSNVQIDSLKFNYQPFSWNNFINIECYTSTEKEYEDVEVWYYLSNDSNVSFKNYMFHDRFNEVGLSFPYSKINIDTVMFPVDSDLYMIAYPLYYYSSNYIDIQTGKAVIPAINSNNASNIAHLVVPDFK